MKLHPNARTTPHTRALIVTRVLKEGWSRSEVADSLGVSLRTVDKWLSRFRLEGHAGLADRSSAPRRSPRRTSIRIVQRIERLRRKRWSAEQIALHIQKPLSTVSVVLNRIGLGRLERLDPKPAPIRYEYDRPGGLLHVDTKKLARFRRPGHRVHGNRADTKTGMGYEFAHVCVDDATRLAYVEVLSDERKESVTQFLRRAVGWFRRKRIDVQRLMTDNGSAYRSKLHAKLCQELGIRHIRTRPYTPRTNGKAERFIGTLSREWAFAKPYRSSPHRAAALADWIHKYNHQRPHRGIGRSTPNQRLRDLR